MSSSPMSASSATSVSSEVQPRSVLSKPSTIIKNKSHQASSTTATTTKKSVRFVSPTPDDDVFQQQPSTPPSRSRSKDRDHNDDDDDDGYSSSKSSTRTASTRKTVSTPRKLKQQLHFDIAEPEPEPELDLVPDTSVIPSKCPIEQGILNDCWLLSTALSFWREPSVNSQFAKQISKFCYLIRLWNIGCEWESYRVHQSNLPQTGGVLIHSPFADYVRYVEGAFLGYFNGAENLAKAIGDPVESYVWLTGGFAERLPFNQSDMVDRRIFAMMVDKTLFTSVQQSHEDQRHSCSVVQWEKLPFGTGNRYLIVDSNLADDERDRASRSVRLSSLTPASSSSRTAPSAASSTTSASASVAGGGGGGHSTPSSRRVAKTGSSSVDSKSELIAQIARTQPANVTTLPPLTEPTGVLTGWYTPQRLVSTFDTCTICRPLIHEDQESVQGRMVQLMSSWNPDVNSGGSRRSLEQFATNPQFIFKLHLLDSPWSRVIDGNLPWLYLSLSQPFRFDKSNYAHIAFHVYRLTSKEPPTSPLRASFFLHTGEIFSSLPYANYSMVCKSYSETAIPQMPPAIPRFTAALNRDDVDLVKDSAPVVYLLVVPSTYFPVKTRTEFLLRVYSEIGRLSFDSAFNFDPKTVNVPWSKFNPDDVDFTPAATAAAVTQQSNSNSNN